MKKILFILVALMTLSTVIYASFPVDNNITEEESDTNQSSSLPYDKETLVVLCCLGFIAVAGMHRFVIGDTLGGILMLITAGGCGIWTLIDLIRISSGNFKY